MWKKLINEMNRPKSLHYLRLFTSVYIADQVLNNKITLVFYKARKLYSPRGDNRRSNHRDLPDTRHILHRIPVHNSELPRQTFWWSQLHLVDFRGVSSQFNARSGSTVFSIWLPEHREKAGREATLARVVTKSHTHTLAIQNIQQTSRYT